MVIPNRFIHPLENITLNIFLSFYNALSQSLTEVKRIRQELVGNELQDIVRVLLQVEDALLKLGRLLVWVQIAHSLLQKLSHLKEQLEIGVGQIVTF